MNIAVFGAGGKVGRLVVAEALERGHIVRAAMHHPGRFSQTAGVTEVTVDVHDPGTVAHALEEADAVISALGSWGTPTKDVLTAGATSIIPAMKAAKIRRIVSLTGSSAWMKRESHGVIDRITHAALGVVGKRVLQDGERHLELLAKSGLAWTVVRSPVMLPINASRYYRYGGTLSLFRFVSRRAVAFALLDFAEGTEAVKEAPHVRSGLW